MKKRLSGIILITITVFTILACKENQEETEKKFYSQMIQELNIEKKYNWVIILPGLGCQGCIQEAELFMKNHIQNRKILFVLTNVSSLKILQQKTGIKISDNLNIYIDKNNKFKLPTDNAIYPSVIQVNDGKYLKHTFQTPQTAAFHNLEKYI